MALPDVRAVEKLVVALDDALGLLGELSRPAGILPVIEQSPASLLEQCMALCTQKQAVELESVRTLHHFACTGGTLISKCLAAMPNTQLLSEVDPLSPLPRTKGKPRFAPTDMITQARQSTRGADADLLIELFLNNLDAMYTAAVQSGQRLIVRDHTHSHFCVGTEIPVRPSLREIVLSRLPVLSIVTVRHPVDSFLSVREDNFGMHFLPATFDEYCRRYVVFLEAYQGVPIFRYEDFVASPCAVMAGICGQLKLPYSDQFVDLFDVYALTGDSGRTGQVIEPRPRRPVEGELIEEVEASANYRVLQRMLGYT